MRTRFVFAAWAVALGTTLALAWPGLASGLPVGSNGPAFDPVHVAGPDTGSRVCPMCKYGQLSGVLIWVNSDDLGAIAPIASRLERAIAERGGARVRAFVISMNPAARPAAEIESRLAAFAKGAALDQVAVAYVPGPADERTSGRWQINPDPRVVNTVFVYRRRVVVDKFVNLGSDAASLDRLVAALEKAAG
ncbi:MAG: hypothetical protein HY049_16065 [Acidobacteria bacterium]|nr:hypothetical protein [Acidobacteriota bacterium]